jgi:alpha-D-xyloside xylohydrolase
LAAGAAGGTGDTPDNPAGHSTMRIATVLLMAVLLGGVGTDAAIGQIAATQPAIERIAPGIWRIRLGQPERFTPMTFRTAPPRLEGLADLPADDDLPFSPGQIHFDVQPRGCAVRLPMDKAERIYGLGLNTQLFDLTDRRTFQRPSDHPENDLNESHAPTPFFVSTRGYGVYVDTARYASFYTGRDDYPLSQLSATAPSAMKNMLVDIPTAQGVDIYVFAGPKMGDAVRRFNLFSGGGCVPPLWGLGMAYRSESNFSAGDVLALAKSFRDDRIPCDVWGLEPGWQTHTYPSSFVWNSQRFSDPDGFIKQMHGMGFHVNVWEHAFTHPTSPMFAALRPWSGDYTVWGGLAPDFATDQARKIFREYHNGILFSKGVDAMKLDECDSQPSDFKPWSFPDASSFPSGLDGEQMHSLLGVLYQQTMLGPFRDRNLRTWGLVRDSDALTAPLPYTIYSDSYKQACYVRGLTKCGFCGLLWTPEVRDATSVEDLYRRIETVIFSPYAMINCWYMRLPPWRQINRQLSNAGQEMAEAKAATQTIRGLFELRMSLIPYLYSAFNEYHRHGTPPIRAMVMDWPDDQQTWKLDDQFMFGPSLLVAPILSGQSGRSVYLPAGNWYDFWTGRMTRGGQRIEVSQPAQTIPLFVKDQTLLAVAAPLQNVAADSCFDVTVRVYGAAPRPATLYEDDGISDDFEQGAQNVITLSWNGKAGDMKKSGGYSGPPRYRISGWEIAGKP